HRPPPPRRAPLPPPPPRPPTSVDSRRRAGTSLANPILVFSRRSHGAFRGSDAGTAVARQSRAGFVTAVHPAVASEGPIGHREGRHHRPGGISGALSEGQGFLRPASDAREARRGRRPRQRRQARLPPPMTRGMSSFRAARLSLTRRVLFD